MNDPLTPQRTGSDLKPEYDFMRDAAELRRRKAAGTLGSTNNAFYRGERMLIAVSMLSIIPPAVMLVLLLLR